MQELFTRIEQQLSQNQSAVLCSIIASSGSTPRGQGAKMAVFPDGSTAGTIGGGAVELKSTQYALEVLQTGDSHTHAFCLAPNEVQDIGMICGGNVTVYFQYFDASSLPLVRAILSLLEHSDRKSWLVTAIRDGSFWSMGVYDRVNGLRFTDAISKEQLQPMLRGESVLQKGEPTYYVEPLTDGGSVYIFGGGHVGQALAPVLHHAGFRVVVFDSRPNAANQTVFPDADEVILGDYSHIADKVQLCEDDCVVIMTPGHQSDLVLLEQTLRTPAGYIGCIGSRHKIAKTKESLLQAGIPEADLQRVCSPIGLPLGGKTPAEVSISVAAELVAYRAGNLAALRQLLYPNNN